MHVHASYRHWRMIKMRTTVELTEPQRAELLRIAAQRGMKGFSTLVQEAIDAFLVAQSSRAALVAAALETRGSLRTKDAGALRERVIAVRNAWR